MISIETAPPYHEGFPMLVAVTVANTQRGLLLSNLPSVGVFDDPLLLRWVARTPLGEDRLLSSGVLPIAEDEPDGFSLDFGERRSMLVDLARVAPDLPAGDYTLRVGYPVDEFVESQAVAFPVLAPPPADAAFAATLFAALPPEQRRWNTFIEPNDARLPSVPDDLSAPVRRLLAWHGFVHRIMRDPRPLAEQPLESVEAIRGGILDAEREALRYELLFARRDATLAEQRRTLGARWPGWTWRIDAVDRGRGTLTRQRERWQRTRRPE